MLYKYLDLRPGLRVVDVGCGTGYLSRLLARGMHGQGEVVGVDMDGNLLKMARSLAEDEHLDQMVKFRKGMAESIPLQDGKYDLVVCQTLLWLFRDPRTPLREMIRICKPGGLVGAIEGGFDGITWFVPDNPRLTELNRKSVRASTKGHMRMYGQDRGIGYKLAPIFKELGLTRIRLDAYAYVWMESDDRIPMDFKLFQHKEFIRRYNRPLDAQSRSFRRVLISGGMSRAEIEERKKVDYERSKRIVEDPSSISDDFATNAGTFYITTGVKEKA